VKKKEPTIITLLDTPAFGGAEQYVLDTSVFLNQNNHKVIIFTNNDHVKQRYNEHIKDNKIKNFEVHHLPYLLDAMGDWKGLVKFFFHFPGAAYWFYRTLKKIKKEEENVTCLLVGFTDRLVFSPIIKYLKVKLIWIDIGPLQPVFKRNWGFPEFLYHATKRFPDHFATTAKFTRDSMIKIGKIAKDNITLVYPGIKLYTKSQIDKYKKLGLTWRKKEIKADVLVGFVGRMASENEVDLLITSFAKARKKTKKKLHLVLIGDGPEKKRFQKLVNSLKINDVTTFTGFVSTTKKFSILAACDLFVFSRAWSWDGFGITTIEAMSVGTPVISPKFGPQMEIVRDNKNGLNFDPHNDNDLAKKIVILSENKKMREKFGKEGLKTVQNNFSYKIMEQSILKAVKIAQSPQSQLT
jgi:glycosyltransferase involved in cell wall biosynthesis